MNFLTGHNTTIRGETASSPLQKRSKTSQNQARFNMKSNTVKPIFGRLRYHLSQNLKETTTNPVYILFSPKFHAKPTPDLGANKKGDRPEVKM